LFGLFGELGVTPAGILRVSARTDNQADTSGTLQRDIKGFSVGVLHSLWLKKELACCRVDREVGHPVDYGVVPGFVRQCNRAPQVLISGRNIEFGFLRALTAVLEFEEVAGCVLLAVGGGRTSIVPVGLIYKTLLINVAKE
jgi:hypothetical protein